MSLLRLLGLGALVASLAACAAPSRPSTTAAPSAAAAPTSKASDSYERVAFGEKQLRVPRVVLLDPGTGARAPLTWAARSTYLLRMSLRHDLLAVGAKEYEDVVDVELTVSVEAREAAPSLTSVIAMIRDAKVPPGHEPGAETDRYTRLVGHGAVWTVTPRGQIAAHGVAIADGRDDLRYDLLVFGRTLSPVLFAPLPSEPVGDGARWRVRAPVFAMGQMQLEETEYTLQTRQPAKHVRDTHIVGIVARVSRVALVEGTTVITDDDDDRVWAAMEAHSQQSFEQLAARIKPVSVGQGTLVFPDTEAMYGEYTWSMRTDIEGSVESASGKEAVHGELRDDIHVRRVDAPARKPAPAPAK